MFEAPGLMKMAQSLARYSGARQAQIAQNVANADVPGYRAKDIKDFAENYGQVRSTEVLVATREKHLTASKTAPHFQSIDAGGEAAPNGNTVSVELELARSTDAKSSHDLALSVYKSSLDILRTSLGRGR